MLQIVGFGSSSPFPPQSLRPIWSAASTFGVNHSKSWFDYLSSSILVGVISCFPFTSFTVPVATTLAVDVQIFG
jgi:hypothetical protein